MKSLVVILVLTVTAVFVSASPLQKSGKSQLIVGGETSAKGRWPWQLSLQRYTFFNGFRHSCGAVLLSPEWALCASHCFIMGEDPEDYKILAGAFRLKPESDAEQTINVEQIILHPEFSISEWGLPNDIALIKLAEPADTNNTYIMPVALASGETDFAGNPDCFITGWGRLHGAAEGVSPELMELNIPCMTNDVCTLKWDEHIIGWIHPLSKGHICVGDDEGIISACQGDSGGPLSCKENGKFVVAGVTSRGTPDCTGFPSIYTRVSEYTDWIKKVTGLKA